MSPNPLKILVERLKNGETEKIHETFSPSFINIQNEKDISFSKDISIVGKAYLADDHLIVDLKIKTAISMPCSICNEIIEIPIDIKDFSDVQELSTIKSLVYDYTEEVRSALLLKLPQFVECNQGNCSERKEIQKYLTKNDPKKVHSPFAEIL